MFTGQLIKCACKERWTRVVPRVERLIIFALTLTKILTLTLTQTLKPLPCTLETPSLICITKHEACHAVRVSVT